MLDENMKKYELEEIYQYQKMVSIGHLSYGIAHEILNPLSGILMYAETLMLHDKFELTKEQIIYNATKIREASTIIKDIITNLQRFALIQDNNFKNDQLNNILDNALQLTKTDLAHAKIEVTKNTIKLPLLKCRSQHIQSLFINIIENTIESFDRNSDVKKELKIDVKLLDDVVRFIFTDNGLGISKDNIINIFEPFFSTKRPKSIGLGLSICHNIVLQHGGKIDIDSIEGKYTTVTIDIPNWRVGDE